jgi:hypothetical protein
MSSLICRSRSHTSKGVVSRSQNGQQQQHQPYEQKSMDRFAEVVEADDPEQPDQQQQAGDSEKHCASRRERSVAGGNALLDDGR